MLRGKMPFRIRRPRQVVGLIYILLYLGIFFTYLFILEDDRSWRIQPEFTAAVFAWFIISLAVKISMFMDRTSELLNLFALVAFTSIGFVYFPQPAYTSSIENFCYYLYFTGGSLCDLCDFVYESAAKRPKNAS
jgi:hypothetical protein